SDHLAGVARDEIEDPRPYCEILRQWSTFHPEFAYLPRKFKIAVTGAEQDRAAVAVHDIGYYVTRNEAGEHGFRVLVGGGQGRTPYVGVIIRPWLETRYLLAYTEAILRVYNRFGRRDNRYKARVKILVNAIGAEEFARQVEEEFEHIKDSVLQLEPTDVQHVARFFEPPEYDIAAAANDAFLAKRDEDPAFERWVSRNTSLHRQAGYRSVFISLKSPQRPPGDATADEMDAIADLAERYSFGQVRVAHDQNLVLADVRENDLHALWQGLAECDLATPNIGLLTDMICCPGLDFCSLANAGSIPIAAQINAAFDDQDYLHDIGELKIKMSGCMNACGHHHVGHIGILGVDKKGIEYYQLTLGGSAENDASIGDRLGPAIEKERVAAVIRQMLDVYVEHRDEDERFIDTYRRIGMAPFRARVYERNDDDRKVA
ncbi:MAG: nitrite/sulfite reductase, partial [Gammaproteobacteria bacterium]|nr:nitrite/sulfite reductase [Gammaproteobacteria bacterium]